MYHTLFKKLKNWNFRPFIGAAWRTSRSGMRVRSLPTYNCGTYKKNPAPTHDSTTYLPRLNGKQFGGKITAIWWSGNLKFVAHSKWGCVPNKEQLC